MFCYSETRETFDPVWVDSFTSGEVKGKLTIMLVPRPGAVRIFNDPFSFLTLARMFANPNPGLVSVSVAMPDPLSVTSRLRVGGSDRRVTLMAVDLAWRAELLMAS